MKRLVALVLVMVTLFTMIACGNNNKAEKYCSSCGEGISKEVAFCEHCGAAVNGEQEEPATTSDNEGETTTVAGETQTGDESTTPPPATTTTTRPPVTTTRPPVTTTHSHSYTHNVTPPTCTAQGYTTHSCSCGHSYKDTYTSPSHTYTEFICHPCGAIDKDNAFAFLVEYIKTNGRVNGTYISLVVHEGDGYKYELKYDTQNNSLWAAEVITIETYEAIALLLLDVGYYGHQFTHKATGSKSELTGFIDPKTFNEHCTMTYETYTGLESTKSNLLTAARNGMVLALLYTERYLDTNNVGLSVYALGYHGL